MVSALVVRCLWLYALIACAVVHLLPYICVHTACFIPSYVALLCLLVIYVYYYQVKKSYEFVWLIQIFFVYLHQSSETRKKLVAR